MHRTEQCKNPAASAEQNPAGREANMQVIGYSCVSIYVMVEKINYQMKWPKEDSLFSPSVGNEFVAMFYTQPLQSKLDRSSYSKFLRNPVQSILFLHKELYVFGHRFQCASVQKSSIFVSISRLSVLLGHAV